MTGFFNKEPDHAQPTEFARDQPASSTSDRRHEPAPLRARDPTQLSARHRTTCQLSREAPDTASVDDLRRFQIWQQSEGVPVPTMNSVVSALRFFFNTTIDRPDLARRLVRLAHPRNLSLFCQIQRMHAVGTVQASSALIQRPRVPLIHPPATSHDRPRTHL